jgi:hypothetical protein
MTAFDPVSAIANIGGKIIDRLWPDPVQREEAKVKLAQLQESGELARMVNETDLVKAHLADTQSARDREVKIATAPEAPLLNKVITPCLAIGVLLASFVLFGVLMFDEGRIDPSRKDILIYILGVLSAICTQIIAYYFGSSAGSTAKDQTIKRALNGGQ